MGKPEDYARGWLSGFMTAVVVMTTGLLVGFALIIGVRP
jgi:hypothetical protein